MKTAILLTRISLLAVLASAAWLIVSRYGLSPVGLLLLSLLVFSAALLVVIGITARRELQAKKELNDIFAKRR